MKKRILALALCLVMVVSLLPVTALAEAEFVEIVDGGTYCGDICFYLAWNPLGAGVSWKRNEDDAPHYLSPDTNGCFKLEAGLGSIRLWNGSFDEDEEGNQIPVEFNITITAGHTDANRDHICDFCDKKYTECVDEAPKDCKCDICGASMHNWKLTTTENSLTYTCQNSGCTIGTVGVSITAHSVTLPDSPFNAKVEYVGAFKEAFPGVELSAIRYDYKDDEGVWHDGIDPTPANAKAGEYQAGVCVSGLSGNGGAAARALSLDGIGSGSESVYLYVKYTAVDPAVTAQTGDNRPIEIMMVSVLLFSALAAAAFLLDHKRRYSR